MVCDFQEVHGVQMTLTPPQHNIQKMLWFRAFFHPNAEGNFKLDLQSTFAEQLVFAGALDSQTSSIQSPALVEELGA